MGHLHRDWTHRRLIIGAQRCLECDMGTGTLLLARKTPGNPSGDRHIVCASAATWGQTRSSKLRDCIEGSIRSGICRYMNRE